MCLRLDLERTDAFKKIFKRPKTFYKAYYYKIENHKIKLISPYRKLNATIRNDHIYSDRGNVKLSFSERYYNVVSSGIHVYGSVKESKGRPAGTIVIPIIGNPEDFVGTNTNRSELVFTKIKINKEKIIKKITYGEKKHLNKRIACFGYDERRAKDHLKEIVKVKKSMIREEKRKIKSIYM